VAGTITFEGGGSSRTETVNVVDLLEQTVRQKDRTVRRHPTWLELPDSGFVLLPQIVGAEALPRGGVHTVTTVQVHHPTLTPDGVFEYQHSWGDTVTQAMANGFDQWCQVDLVVFEDALLPRPRTCTTMEMTFPAKEGKPAYCRRAVLGPIAHFRASPPPPDAAPEQHPFCSCCFLTNTFMAYKQLVEGTDFFALRYFAARGEDGTPQADCRVNGDDCPPGVEALRNYVKTWTGTGYEFRKQYVLLQTLDRPTAVADEGPGDESGANP
jgi:hypothetical protein